MSSVIVGDGIAGSSAAETIREADVESDVTVITDEGETLYNRILIKELSGPLTVEDGTKLLDTPQVIRGVATPRLCNWCWSFRPPPVFECPTLIGIHLIQKVATLTHGVSRKDHWLSGANGVGTLSMAEARTGYSVPISFGYDRKTRCPVLMGTPHTDRCDL